MGIKSKIIKAVAKPIAKIVAKIAPKSVARAEAVARSLPTTSNIARNVASVATRAGQSARNIIASTATKMGSLPKTILGKVAGAGKLAVKASGVAGAGLLAYSVYDAIRDSRSGRGTSPSGTDAVASGSLGASQEDTMGLGTKLTLGAIGAGGLYGAEQLAEALGIRGGAGFIGDRPLSASMVRRLTGRGVRHKQGLFNRRALKTMTKAQRYEKQAVKILRKRGLMFSKHKKSSSSLNRDEIMLYNMMRR